MAIWTDMKGNDWSIADGKLNFKQWVGETDERQDAYDVAATEYQNYIDTNNAEPTDCAAIDLFEEWIIYAEATPVTE